jgi:hypothetical protein
MNDTRNTNKTIKLSAVLITKIKALVTNITKFSRYLFSSFTLFNQQKVLLQLEWKAKYKSLLLWILYAFSFFTNIRAHDKRFDAHKTIIAYS